MNVMLPWKFVTVKLNGHLQRRQHTCAIADALMSLFQNWPSAIFYWELSFELRPSLLNPYRYGAFARWHGRCHLFEFSSRNGPMVFEQDFEA